ncbi:peptidoglycan DD-metalloendopeptidase family protein [Candidatus Falkowbacteria bacterium]|nr:peptidoglycan DD-metalloendopeptidase family protein [Candidatus Falkowbacteria bacterium]
MSKTLFYAMILLMLKKITQCTFLFCVISMLMLPIFFANAQTQEEIDQINKQIENKKQYIQDLNVKAEQYKKNIAQKQKELVTLKNQTSILENQIAKNKIDIETTDVELQETKLEIRNIEIQIVLKEDEIAKKKDTLGILVREFFLQDQEGLVDIIFGYNSIAEFFQQVEYLKNLQNSIRGTLEQLKTLKQNLENKKVELDVKKQNLVKLGDELAQEKAYLNEHLNYKAYLLKQTKASEQKFHDLYWAAKQEQNQANVEIYKLEKEARAAMENLKKTRPELKDSNLIWPVSQNKITAYFHDSTYPFRNIFEHPAIDIRASQGTQIKAAADGYVIKTRDAGMGYSYIALIHANGFSTVYGHVSKIFIEEDDFVSKGEVIGLTGGMPGTPGAGWLSTGPHLHFEVRANGIPVNPLDYLP